MRYFKRRWEESRGDEHDSWGASAWYFEVGVDGHVVRQLEVYDAGVVLAYEASHAEDEFGRLAEQAIDLEEFSAFEIGRTEFEAIWASSTLRNR